MKAAALLLFVGAIAYAQSSGVPALPMNVQILTVPASSSATYLNLTVDPSAAGGDFVDVLSPNSQVLISLILPNGTEVTPANASSLGFTVLQETNTPGTTSTSGVFTPFDVAGAHTTFILPSGSPGGTYQVKANSSNVSATTSIAVTYFSLSLSGVKAGISKDKLVYNPGNNVTLTAVIFSGSTGVTGATVTATVVPPVNLSAQGTIGNYRVVNQTTNNGFSQFTYQASLTNTASSAFTSATAKPMNVPSTVTLIDAGNLGFANVPASGSTTSVNTFTIQVASGQVFDPTTLSWDISATGSPATITLPDSGNGSYTGTYTPTATGLYQVLVNLSGAFAGSPFARTLSTTFQVVNSIATLSGVSDSAVDDNGNGLPDRLVLSAQVNVQTPGNYYFSVSLSASNGKMMTATGKAALASGAGHIDASVPTKQLLQLGVDGPYEKVRAAVSQLAASGQPIGVGSISDAGPTVPYTLASFDRGPIYFTGQNSATGVITGAGPTFDLLRVQIGIYSAVSGTCSFSAELSDAAGNSIDFATGKGTVATGNGTVTLDFNGNAIAQAGPGPYQVRAVTVTCAGNRATSGVLFTSGFTASQFTFVPSDFTLAPNGPLPTVAAGTTRNIPLLLSSTGPFKDDVSFAVSGLPIGATGTFYIPTVRGSGPTALVLQTQPTLAAGNYSFTIAYSTATVSKTLPVTITVTPPITVVVNPPSVALGANQSQQFTATVSGTSNTAVTWSLSGTLNTLGNIDPNTGLYFSGNISDGTIITVTATSLADNFTKGTATLTIAYPVAATPVFSVTPGSYNTPQTVALSTTTPNATIVVTVDGSDPPDSPTSFNYLAPIGLSATATIKAVAIAGYYANSPAAIGNYTVAPIAPAAYSPPLTDDTYVTPGSPDGNFGTAETMHVDTFPGSSSLLKFDLSALSAAGVPASSVSQALLFVWVDSLTKPGLVDLFLLAGPWSETNVTRNTWPGITSQYFEPIGEINMPQSGAWVAADVTNSVQSWLANPATNNGLTLTSGFYYQHTPTAQFDSKENTATSNYAHLQLTLNGFVTQTAPVLGDTYITTSAPTSNFGAAASLNVGNSAEALVQFDLTGLPSSQMAANLAQAQLLLWVDQLTSAGALDIAPLTSAWSENSVNANTAPVLGNVAATVPVTRTGAWVPVDVTSLVASWLNGPATNFGIAVSASASAPNTSIGLDSKENTATKHPPQLQMLFTAPPVFVSPARITLSATETQQFNAAVTLGNTAVTWSINPNVGTISSTGLYTAPASIGTQQTVTVTATSVADATKSGSATVTLNPSQVAPTVSFTGAPASAAYLSTFTVSSTTNASTTAAIAASGACSISGNVATMTSGTGICQLTATWAADQNYLTATATQSTTATKAAATVSLNAGSLSQTYNGTAESVTATTYPTGLTLNVTYNGSSQPPVNAGNYSVVATINDPNYQGNTTGTLHINKATLTVTANNSSRTYGAANPAFTASYSGFVNGDTFASAVSGSPSLTTAATSTSLPGTYPIVAASGTLASTNYGFVFVNGTLTIAITAVIPASATTCNGAYNGTFNGNVTIASGQTCIFVGGGITGNVALNGGSLTLSSATVGGNVAGQGNMTLTGTARVNGTVTLSGGQLSADGGASIGGNATLSGGGSLTLGNAGIGGSLVMNGGGTFSIGPSATIDGSVTIQSEASSATQSQVCGATVKGNFTVKTNGRAIQIGSATPASCAGNRVGGNVTIQQNTAATGVFDNAITGILTCQNNTSIAGAGNTAALKQGQCVGF